jgi:hypothetical protein
MCNVTAIPIELLTLSEKLLFFGGAPLGGSLETVKAEKIFSSQ